MRDVAIVFSFLLTFLVASFTGFSEAWDSLPESTSPLNLGLGKQRFEITVTAAAFFGLLLSVLSLVLGLEPWIWIPVTPCVALTSFAFVILPANLRGLLSRSKRPRETHPIRWRSVAVLAATFVSAFYLGSLFSADHNSERRVEWSPYHVKGTETNGSGFVNECREPSPCAGKDPVGRLQEGDPAYIECQVKGDPDESIGGETSRIWDRLYSGAFVSDLFVDTPGAGRFSSDIDRCTLWK
jgi:hypothetical protein